MRISDWSSDVCSSDLSTSDSASRPDLQRRHPRQLVRIAHDEDGVHHTIPDIESHRRIGPAIGLVGHHAGLAVDQAGHPRSEEHTSELQSLMRISYAVFCLKKKKTHT